MLRFSLDWERTLPVEAKVADLFSPEYHVMDGHKFTACYEAT